MRNILLLCMGLGCGLVGALNATTPERKDSSNVNVAAIAERYYQVIPGCSKGEMIRFAKACPHWLRETLQNQEIDWNTVTINDDFAILNDSSNLLTIAINEDCINIVRYFIAKGANLNKKSYSGCLPIHSAVRYASTSMVGLLLDSGISVNQADSSPKKLQPLHFATARSAEMFNFLLSRGADVNGRTQDLQTPLHCAISGLSFNTGEVLFIVSSLIKNKADVNAQDSDENTPLHLLALHRSDIVAPIAEILIAAGAKLNIKNKKGETVFDIARKRNNQNLLDLLDSINLSSSKKEACLIS